MSAGTWQGVARWLLAAFACPAIGFWVSTLLPLGDAGQSDSGLAYLVVGIQNLALLALLHGLVSPLLLPRMADNVAVAILVGLVVAAPLYVRFYLEMNIDPQRGASPIALVDLRNEAVAMAVTIVLFSYVGLRGNPVFGRCRQAIGRAARNLRA